MIVRHMSALYSEPPSLPDTLVDNDIVLKLCQINYLNDFARCLGNIDAPIQILGSLRFVLNPLIASQANDVMRTSFDRFLTDAEVLEPSDAEVILAAQLAEAASRTGHAVDGGESLLFAVALTRSAKLATGDKRAVKGFAAIADEEPNYDALKGSIVTLEYIVSALVERHGSEIVRAAICAVPDADRTLSICFRCQGNTCTKADVIDALGSYQRNLSQETAGFVTPMLAL